MSPTTRTVHVEDEECDRMFMEAAFQKAGMGKAPRAVVDRREAMRYLGGSGVYAERSQHPVPAVVMLDLNLPLASGLEVLKWMREQAEVAAAEHRVTRPNCGGFGGGQRKPGLECR